MNRYLIVTPCRNEATYLRFPLESVARQTISPAVWVVVDDGSTDSSAVIVHQASAAMPFLRYHYRNRPEGSNYFASNVYAIMEGIKHVCGEELFAQKLPDFIAILDADITLSADYYEQILGRFAADPQLGIASGIYENLIDGRLVPVLNDRRSTPKALMVFRRECWEQIGGLLPLPHGGEDTAACVAARMKGWRVWSFPEIRAVHHRPTGTGNASGILRARWSQGWSEYLLGSHPLFFLVKCLRRCLREKPYLVGGVWRMLGYAAAALKREPRTLPAELIAYLRAEQLGRLCTFNKVKYGGNAADHNKRS